MENIILECFRSFKCKGGCCTDNCCIGWEIDIDEDTLRFYDSLSGEIKKRLNSAISREDVPHFILDENGRCPFLNSDNLCDIIIELGEEKIPYICKNHPRFYTWLPEYTEAGMGLCCEEAVRLLLEKKEKLKITVSNDSTSTISGTMAYARNKAFEILQNRVLSISERLSLFLDFCYALDEHLMFENLDMLIKTVDSFPAQLEEKTAKARSIRKITELFASLEPIDNKWTALSEGILKHNRELIPIFSDFHSNNREIFYKYEHLAVYFTYRHFLNCLDDYDIVSKGRFIVLSIIYCGICDAYSLFIGKAVSTEKIARLYSKEVEYSADNTQIVSDTDIKNIKGLLPLVFGR